MSRSPASPRIVDEPLPLVLNRPFYVNRLATTHRQLLLRSPIGDLYADNIDILFKGVTAVKMVFELSSIEIRMPTADEYEMISADCGERILGRQGTQCYMISGGPSVGYIVALSAFKTVDKEHPANDSRLLFGAGYDVEPPDVVTRLI